MRRKTTALLTFLLSATLLGACGNTTQQTATNDNEVQSGATTNTTSSTNKGVQTISEALSNDKVICYKVSNVDKSETPDTVYFFDGGKLTIIPGEEFGKTLGDFANMTEDDIWSEYETAKTSYKESYIADKEKSIEGLINENYQDNIDSYQKSIDKLMAVKGKNRADVTQDEADAADVVINYWVGEKSYAEDAETFFATYENEMTEFDSGVFSETIVGIIIEEEQSTLDKLESEKAEYEKTLSYKGPFFDLPFTVVVQSDSTGNYTETEKIVYPTLSDDVEDTTAPSSTYDSIDIVATVEGADKQIYDTTYDCIPLDDGKTLCTRASLTVDGTKSENVLLDPDDLNGLYKDIVNARYE